MTPQLDDLHSEIEKSLQSLAEEKGEEIAMQIRPILVTNLDRGRVQGFTEGQISRIRDYVSRVAERYELLHDFVYQIQILRSTDVWDPLFNELQTWCFKYLLRKSYNNPSIANEENATECAIDASQTIVNAFFPYDVDFDPWAHMIVIHVCQKFMRSTQKKSTVRDESLLALDELMETIKDPKPQDEEHQKDLAKTLAEAIAQLEGPRREVIRMIYFEGLSPKEVAQKLGKTVGAIYNLHFNALRDLKKILGRDRDKFNE